MSIWIPRLLLEGDASELPPLRFDGRSVDVALIDLRGEVRPLLALIHRFRTKADPGLVLVGLMPAEMDPVARLYLSAVLDVVVDAMTCPGRLKEAILAAIEDDFTQPACMPAALPPTCH